MKRSLLISTFATFSGIVFVCGLIGTVAAANGAPLSAIAAKVDAALMFGGFAGVIVAIALTMLDEARSGKKMASA